MNKAVKLTEVAIEIGQDAFCLSVGVPPVNTLKRLAPMIIEKLTETDNLFKEVFIDCDRQYFELDDREKKELSETCYSIYQYSIQGKAKHNIKLLIKYLKGQIESKGLYIDDFHKYRDILATLTKSEIEFCSKHIGQRVITLGQNFEVRQDIEFVDKIKYVCESYSLQGKGLLSIDKQYLDGDTGVMFYIKSTTTPLFNDMFKNLNLDLEELL